MTFQEAIKKLKTSHPDLYPVWYVEEKGMLFFNMLKRGVPKEESVCNVYAVRAGDGTVVGPMSILTLYSDPTLSNKIKSPHMISAEDQKPIEHGVSANGGDFLMHYGIPGMKWGIRRFQNKDGSLTKEGKERYGGSPYGSKEEIEKIGSSKGITGAKKVKGENGDKKPGFFERQRIAEAEAGEKWFRDMANKGSVQIDRETTKEGNFDKGRVVADVALTVINPINVAYLAADGVMAGMAKKKEKSYFEHREEKSDLDPKTGLYVKKEGSYNEKQDLAAVNPGYMNMNTNTKNNCMLCSTTYDLRKRGFDVTAQLDSVGYDFNDLKRWYPKAKIEKTSRFDENGRALNQKEYIEKTMNNLKKQGDGARGNIMIAFKFGGAHSVVYEIKNGEVIFKDGQTGLTYKKSGFSLKEYHQPPETILYESLVNSYARLDNVAPDLKKIKAECVR